jgi:hypothetical protein
LTRPQGQSQSTASHARKEGTGVGGNVTFPAFRRAQSGQGARVGRWPSSLHARNGRALACASRTSTVPTAKRSASQSLSCEGWAAPVAFPATSPATERHHPGVRGYVVSVGWHDTTKRGASQRHRGACDPSSRSSRIHGSPTACGSAEIRTSTFARHWTQGPHSPGRGAVKTGSVPRLIPPPIRRSGTLPLLTVLR